MGVLAGPPQQHRVSPGVDSVVEEEVQRLRSRVDVLEQVRPGLGTRASAWPPHCLLSAVGFGGGA